MAFKNRPKTVDIDFTALLPQLVAAKLQAEQPALYDTIKGLIEKNQQNKQQVNQILQSFFGDITINDDVDLSAILAAIANLNNIINFATFWTQNDETVRLPSSRKVIAGTGILLDYTTPGEVTIEAVSGDGTCFIPMVNGNEPPELMSNGAGDLLLIPYTP